MAEVGLRSTRLLTRDDIQISIPNSLMTNTKVINESAPRPRFRVRIKVGVAYGSDVNKVEEILLSLAKGNNLVAMVPEPRVRFRTFGDSSLEFELLCWAFRPQDKGRLIHALNHQIYNAFAAAGIQIPFPQRDVHVHALTQDAESSD
ncbi:MAG: mechanosensitive ion channel [Deltaproteobacteria bacterium]|nr:mechanosensitive ion channel [Deltaproteobacteria bacterium]